MKDIERYYDENAEEELKRLDGRPLEFAYVQRALREYLPPVPARVIDIGAGPGRYASHLSQLGYRVTLVDLSSASLQLAKRHAHPRMEAFIHADARSLGMLGEGSYGAALLMGPLYHLLDLAERREAVLEATRLLEKGGVTFAMFMNRFGALRYLAAHDPTLVVREPIFIETFLAAGEYRTDKNVPDTYNALPSEIRPFMESCGLTTEALIGCEGFMDSIEAETGRLGRTEREKWLDLTYQVAKDPSTHGESTHLLYVGRRS